MIRLPLLRILNRKSIFFDCSVSLNQEHLRLLEFSFHFLFSLLSCLGQSCKVLLHFIPTYDTFVSTQSITVSSSTSMVSKGRHVIATNPMCRSRCIACHLCELYCPSLAILLIGSSLLLRSSSSWSLDSFRCVVCGLCQDVCPVVAITERYSHQPSRTDVHPYPVLS